MEKEYKNLVLGCQNCSGNFTIEPDDFVFYEKIKVPPPTCCPECRSIRRMLWRNETAWHRRICDATGKQILSMYSPDEPYKVYDEAYWKSDAWDPFDYGKEYDFNKSFFFQFKELFENIPHPNLIQKNNINSEYTNHTLNLKNVYFSVSADTAEDSAYLFNAILRVKNCYDLHLSNDSEFCYELVDCAKSSRLFFSQNSEACLDSVLLYDCRNCSNCFGCVGLRNASYCIFNVQYSREEYFEKLKQYWNGSHDSFLHGKEIFENLKLNKPRKYAQIVNSINVLGDDIINSRNCKFCFSVKNNVENCKYSYRIWENSKDGYDAMVAWKGAELFYEVLSVQAQRTFFSAYIWGGFDIYYSINCFDCNNLFGCVGLRNKSYCIFNKQYSKEEYEKLIPKIIEHMHNTGEYGEFFPKELSPFAYNETTALYYYPKTKEQVLELGYRWKNQESKSYNISIKEENIPDNISDIDESFSEEIIECAHIGKCEENCSTAFRLTKNEIQFYKKMNIPIPHLCPLCRHGSRIKSKPPLKFWHRSCMKEGCNNEFETSYAPDRPEIVYCEKCYKEEVY